VRRALGLLVILVLAGSAPVVAWHRVSSDPRTLDGLRVEGRAFPPTRDPEVVVRDRADAWLDAELAVHVDEVHVRRTRRQLGARIDVDPLVRELSRLGHQGSLVDDLDAWNRARTGAIDLRWEVTVDEDVVRAFLEGLTERVDRAPVEARISREGTLLQEPVEGRAIDLERATPALLAAVREEEIVFALPVTTERLAPPPLPPAREAFGERVGTWVSRVPGSRGRVHNVALAAERLDGALLPPHGVLSFNTAVGARTRSAGFRVAPVIVDGELVPGIGGGTCQVASTLHAAAFAGGFEILEHVPHSRPAGYVPLGLDATVVYPQVDLQLRNPYPWPVRVRAVMEGPRRLRVDLFGAGPGAAVDVGRRVVSRSEFGERVVEDPTVPYGTERVTEDGIPGYTVQRIRTVHRDGAPPVREERFIRYPPTDRIVRIPAKELTPPASATAPREGSPPPPDPPS